MRLAPVTSAETVAWGARHRLAASPLQVRRRDLDLLQPVRLPGRQVQALRRRTASRLHPRTSRTRRTLAAYLTGRRGYASALGAVFLVCHLRLVQLCGDCLCQLRQDLLLHLKLQGGRHPHNERLLERDDTLKQRERR